MKRTYQRLLCSPYGGC